MSKLPKKYAWLAKEPAPRHLLEALKLYGTLETPGAANNPEIMKWAAEVGLTKTYSGDEVPWCGLFMAVVIKRAGREPVSKPLWARNWWNFGVKVPIAALGDVLVFVRNGGGHVGIYVGEDKTAYHVLGGNQSDSVNIVRIAKNRCIDIRRPAYRLQPANVRVVNLSGTGKVSTNEA